MEILLSVNLKAWRQTAERLCQPEERQEGVRGHPQPKNTKVDRGATRNSEEL